MEGRVGDGEGHAPEVSVYDRRLNPLFIYIYIGTYIGPIYLCVDYIIISRTWLKIQCVPCADVTGIPGDEYTYIIRRIYYMSL